MRYNLYKLSSEKLLPKRVNYWDIAFYGFCGLAIFVYCIGISTINMYGPLW